MRYIEGLHYKEIILLILLLLQIVFMRKTLFYFSLILWLVFGILSKNAEIAGIFIISNFKIIKFRKILKDFQPITSCDARKLFYHASCR